jgi:hypothetical protein
MRPTLFVAPVGRLRLLAYSLVPDGGGHGLNADGTIVSVDLVIPAPLALRIRLRLLGSHPILQRRSSFCAAHRLSLSDGAKLGSKSNSIVII